MEHGLVNKTIKNKNPIIKFKKIKNRSRMAACEQKKNTSDKAIFCSSTVLSLYFKFNVKKFQAAKPLAFFRSTFCSSTKIITSVRLQKSFNYANRLSAPQYNSAPQYYSNSLNCERTKRRPIIASASFCGYLN